MRENRKESGGTPLADEADRLFQAATGTQRCASRKIARASAAAAAPYCPAARRRANGIAAPEHEGGNGDPRLDVHGQTNAAPPMTTPNSRSLTAAAAGDSSSPVRSIIS
jgi:hypothetical protein